MNRRLLVCLLAGAVLILSVPAPASATSDLQGDNYTYFTFEPRIQGELAENPSSATPSSFSSLAVYDTVLRGNYYQPVIYQNCYKLTSTHVANSWCYRSQALNIPQGSDFSIKIRGCWRIFSNSSSSYTTIQDIDFRVKTFVLTSDGNYTLLDNRVTTYSNGVFTISGTADYKIKNFFIVIGRTRCSLSAFGVTSFSNYNSDYTYYCAPCLFFGSSYYEDNSQNGLLAGILSKISDLLDFVLTIPSLILDGIKNLFVPSSSDLNSIYDDFSSLMEEKLGAVWECFDVVYSIFNGLTSTSEAGTIDFPGISLSLAGATFSIPAQSVALWPSGFEALRDTVRTATTFTFICAFVSGLIRWMSRFLGDDSE